MEVVRAVRSARTAEPDLARTAPARADCRPVLGFLPRRKRHGNHAQYRAAGQAQAGLIFVSTKIFPQDRS
jgi:hypothetical protein